MTAQLNPRYLCHWEDCTQSFSAENEIHEHMDAHLETCLPHPLDWRRDLNKSTTSNVAQATETSAATASTSAPSSTTLPEANAVGNHVVQYESSGDGHPYSSAAAIPSDDMRTPPHSPAVNSSQPKTPFREPIPSPTSSRKSFSALNSLSDDSPELNDAIFSSPSPNQYLPNNRRPAREPPTSPLDASTRKRYAAMSLLTPGKRRRSQSPNTPLAGSSRTAESNVPSPQGYSSPGSRTPSDPSKGKMAMMAEQGPETGSGLLLPSPLKGALLPSLLERPPPSKPGGNVSKTPAQSQPHWNDLATQPPPSSFPDV
ncbi:hypothetical protein DL93DRAFT_2162745 [Clavulina sp. PMI_390]|nr:hypothetical protein DL93DRAFT_2162745 [Clavulina sp. PMI_390]